MHEGEVKANTMSALKPDERMICREVAEKLSVTDSITESTLQNLNERTIWVDTLNTDGGVEQYRLNDTGAAIKQTHFGLAKEAF
ncbi:MAG: hypothetical protein HOE62_15610 [Alphaproteobacteria bacterium]|mgnify:CR=1 FL=1|jgi:hypothetical protein|nr:hypothetical protein [Alphaproteobacteria bacterium]MBT4019378.1 hypothetical protein [Alphaproteobacteria bacterium]MBT7744558.1 hypothetical protein [Alphaproteobacteria bacterium]